MAALIKFYHIDNVWHLGQWDALSAGCWSLTTDEDGRMVIALMPPHTSSVERSIYARGYYNEFCDANGNAYTSQAAFDKATNNFFATGRLNSLIDEKNSTTTNLAANATFTGEWTDASEYGTVTVSVMSDTDSSLNGFKVEYSADASTVVQDDKYTILGGISKVFTQTPANQYYRVKYINGAQLQTHFCIQSICRTAAIKNSSHRIADSIIADDDAELVKAVITGRRDSGTFGDAILDNANRVQTNSQPYGHAIAEGMLANHLPLLKFGVRTSIAAGVTSTIWEGTAALYQYLSAASQLSVVSASASDSSTGTGARTVVIHGLDADFNEQTEEVVMNGTTPVVTAKSYIRAYRAYVQTCGTAFTNVGDVNVTSVTGGLQLIRMPAGDGQTLMTIWTVPANMEAYMTQLSVSNDSGKGARFAIFTRLNDGGILYPWQIKYRGYIIGGLNHLPLTIPLKIPAKTDIEVRFLTPTSAGITSGGASFELWYRNL